MSGFIQSGRLDLNLVSLHFLSQQNRQYARPLP
jgi:hypothetical protein